MAKPTDLGHLITMALKIDAPIPMDVDLEFRELVLFCGKNGTGKSLILKLSWVLGTIMGMSVVKKMLLTTGMDPKIDIESLSQYTFDKSFDDQNFNGTIGANYEQGSISITLEHGKVLSVDVTLAPEVNSCPPTIFMSTNMRTFDQITQYLKIAKIVDTEDKMTEFYKLYDIAYIKFLQVKLEKGLTATPKFKDTLKQFELEKLELETIEMTDESVYYTNTKGQRLELTTLSKGEQSIINMFLANS